MEHGWMDNWQLSKCQEKGSISLTASVRALSLLVTVSVIVRVSPMQQHGSSELGDMARGLSVFGSSFDVHILNLTMMCPYILRTQ